MEKKDLLKIWGVIIVLGIIFLPPFIKYQRLLHKKRSLDAEIKSIKAESSRMENERERLKGDIVYIEKRARENIGVVRKGEIILKEPSQKK